MSNTTPRFSIVVPIYNEERFIREALDSILAQTDPDWEALLVDDGSTDTTPGILDDYAARDGRFRVFHKKNGGQSTAINMGVQEASGEWLCWLSGDDYFHPNKLKMNRDWIQAYPDINFFFSACQFVYENREPLDYSLPWLDVDDDLMRLIYLFRSNFLSGISICIRRETWLMHKGFDVDLRYAHDLDMWLRLLCDTPAHYEPNITCYMRFHSVQESAMFPLGTLFDASKTIIRLLNAHTFQELFPTTDLHQEMYALKALTKTLDLVACVPDSNLLYGLGFHPALQMRILEWIRHYLPNPDLAQKLNNVLRDRSEKMSRLHSNTPFGMFWNAIEVAVSLPDSHFKYFTIEPAEVGSINYYLQKNKDFSQQLSTYLNRYDGLQLNGENETGEPWHSIALILPSDITLDDQEHPELLKILTVCQDLTKAGNAIFLIGQSNFTLGYIKGFLYLGIRTKEDIEQVISGLKSVELIVSFIRIQTSSRSDRRKTTNVILTPGFDYQDITKTIRQLSSGKERFLIKRKFVNLLKMIVLKTK